MQVKIQGEPYKIPTSISDVSIGKFIEFRNIDPNNYLSLVHWAIGGTPFFKDSKTIELEITNVIALIQPVVAQMYDFINHKSKNELPNSIEILGSHVKIKKGLLDELPYWAYEITKKVVLDGVAKDAENFDVTDQIPKVLAHYLYTYTTGVEYTEKKAEEYIDVINDLPMIPAIQLGNFFLKKHQGLFQLKKSYLKPNQNRTILKLV